MLKRCLQLLCVGFAVATIVWIGCQWAVSSHASDILGSDATPVAPVAIVLGAGLRPDGTPSDMLADRLSVAARLYRDGAVGVVLASGDNGSDEHDEVNAMRTYLLDAGVAPEDLFLDHAGFDTYDTMYRARHVFGVTEAVVVTQEYHLPRALYVARSLGIEAVGVSADLQPYVRQRWFSVRESFARVKAVLDVARGARPRFTGDPIDLSGDGRETWD